MRKRLHKFCVATLGILAIVLALLGFASFVIPISYEGQKPSLPGTAVSIDYGRLDISAYSWGFVGVELDVDFAGLVIRTEWQNDVHFEEFRKARTPNNVTLTLVACPAWIWFLAVVVLGAYPAIAAFRRYKRNRRRSLGHCASCGYDLTGNTSGVCPECGTAQQSGGA